MRWIGVRIYSYFKLIKIKINELLEFNIHLKLLNGVKLLIYVYL
jgi:hypothetical protein